MSSAFKTLLDGLKSALLQAPALAGGRISLNQRHPVALGQSDAIVLRQGPARGDSAVTGLIYWANTITVECFARAPEGSEVSPAVDDLLAAVWQRLAAIDAGVLGACVSIDPQIEWDFTDTEACATLHLTLQHDTQAASLQPRI